LGHEVVIANVDLDISPVSGVAAHEAETTRNDFLVSVADWFNEIRFFGAGVTKVYQQIGEHIVARSQRLR
jgi:hypothetical protein